MNQFPIDDILYFILTKRFPSQMSDSAISVYFRISKRPVKGLVKELLVSIEKKQAVWNASGFLFFFIFYVIFLGDSIN